MNRRRGRTSRGATLVGIAIALGAAAAPIPAQGFHLDYRPTADVDLDTDGTFIQPTTGPRVFVPNGVFVFRNVTIPAGVRVQGSGSRPMIWIVANDFVVDGRLSVDGRDGESVNTVARANVPVRGGEGSCSGGDGGNGSPLWFDRSFQGAAGFGPFQLVGFGGSGGSLSCTAACARGAAGGGGSFATFGDPYYPPGSAQTWPQMTGRGGQGCLDRSLPGAPAGVRLFFDARDDNDFFGVGFDVSRSLPIVGELNGPIGGSGGGGGGDRSFNCAPNDPGFVTDSQGGGGGGGGGALGILAAGRVRVGATGWISANGGNGGGGEQAGGNNLGGGGGGGSGGMVLLLAMQKIELVVHGETYGRLDYSFSISADGGIGVQSSWGGAPIAAKYPPGNPTWNTKPAGGFGGLGVVELITPVGTNGDGTNTIFDDGIDVIRGTQVLTGAEKQRYLAWRGFPDASGIWRDDAGNAIVIGKNEGDIRPSPILLPLLR